MAEQRGWPEGYPDYFDQHGIVRREYILDYPKRIAERLGAEGLTRNQLQAFYRHIRRLSDSLDYVSPDDSDRVTRILRKLQAVVPLAHSSRGRRVIPAFFYEFLEKNIQTCDNARTFREGFVEHFQAVVGFCAGRLYERGGE